MDERTPGIRPRPTLARRLDSAARHAFPAASAAVLLLLAAGPLGLPAQAQPAVALACVFFWSVFRPGAMPPPVVFLLGVLADLLGQVPVGVSALTLLAAHGLATRARRWLARQGFLAVWLAFVVVAAAAAVLDWALASLLRFQALPPAASVFQFALTAGFYPAMAAWMTRAHRGIADPNRT